jgi:hypothetical protein
MATEDEKQYLRRVETEPQKFEVLTEGNLELPMTDSELLSVISKRVKASEQYYETKLDLKKRRAKNTDYWRGKQLDTKLLYDWQVPYIDNVIYRDVETAIPIVVSKLPDIIVSAASEDPIKRKRADGLQKVLDYKIKNHEMRSVLRRASRHSFLDFITIVKARWDRVRQTYIFEAVHPDKITLDHTGRVPDFGLSSSGFDFIAEWLEEPLKVITAKFPKAKDKLWKRFDIKQGRESQLANKIRYQEIWFTWYDDTGVPFEGVAWRFEDIILEKMKNPYWDYEGEETEAGTNPITGETVYENRQFNHFDRPYKPYIIRNYQHSGLDGPMDDTTPVEQSIPLQDVINKRGRQITELADKANPKKVFSDTFITKEDAARVTDDPTEHIWGSGNVNEGFAVIPGIAPNPTLYNDLLQNRAELDNIMGTQQTVRGERTADESGVARQIAREGSLGRLDDFVATVIEPITQEIAEWSVQMLKVFGTKTTFIEVLGSTGEKEFLEFDRDAIDDGVNISVRASTVDKTERRSIATQLAASGNIDPLSLYEDLGAKDPKERARRIMAMKDPTGATYMQLILNDPEGADTAMDNVAAANAAESGTATGASPESSLPAGPEAPLPSDQLIEQGGQSDAI